VEPDFVLALSNVHGAKELVGSQDRHFPPVEGRMPIRIEAVEEDYISRAAKVGLKQDGIRFPADNLHLPRGA
jgi:hypothetical protein